MYEPVFKINVYYGTSMNTDAVYFESYSLLYVLCLDACLPVYRNTYDFKALLVSCFTAILILRWFSVFLGDLISRCRLMSTGEPFGFYEVPRRYSPFFCDFASELLCMF